MEVRFVGKSIDKYEYLIAGCTYTLKGSDVWVIDGDDSWVIVRVTAEEALEHFEHVINRSGGR